MNDGGPGFGRGRGNCNGGSSRHCSWSTFTGTWGPDWLVSWSGFGGDDNDCSSTLTGSTLATATSPASASAAVTGATRSPSVGATVVTTVNGQTLTGTIFSAQRASTATGTVRAVGLGGQPGRNEKAGAFAAMVFAFIATVCML